MVDLYFNFHLNALTFQIEKDTCYRILGDNYYHVSSSLLRFFSMNIGVHRFFWIGVSGFLGYNPSSGIAGSKGRSIFNILR